MKNRFVVMGAGVVFFAAFPGVVQAQTANEAANRLFVQSVQAVEKAKKLKDLKKRLTLLTGAREGLEQIVTTYPQSDLAVKIVITRSGRFSTKAVDEQIRRTRAGVAISDFQARCLPDPSTACLVDLLNGDEIRFAEKQKGEYIPEEFTAALQALVSGDKKPFLSLLRNQGKNLKGLIEPFYFANKMELLADLLVQSDRVILHGRREFSSRQEALIHLGRKNHRLRTPKVAEAEMARQMMCSREGRFLATGEKELQADGLFPALLRLTMAICKNKPALAEASAYLGHLARRGNIRLQNFPTATNIFEMLESFERTKEVFQLALDQYLRLLKDSPDFKVPDDIQPHDLDERISHYAAALIIKRIPD